MSSGSDLPGDIARVSDALEKATREVRELVAALLGPAFNEAGELLGDQVGNWKFRNRVRLFEKTRRLLEERGLTPGAVPLRQLLPIVEMVNNEDDEDLSTRWAGLLASAATGETVPPSYPRILAELSPREARILDSLYPADSRYPRDVFLKSEEFAPSSEFDLSMETLQRLGLCEGKREDPLKGFMEKIRNLYVPSTPSKSASSRSPRASEEKNKPAEEIAKKLKDAVNRYDMDSFRSRRASSFALTKLGHDFVRVCRGPVGRAT